MEVTKQYYEREGCNYFYLKQDNKILEITFGGNLDLYWSLKIIREHKENLDEIMYSMYDEVKDTFIITKENYFIYSLFEELYNDVLESRIFVPIHKREISDETELELDDDDFDVWKKYDESDFQRRNEWYKNQSIYKKLYNGKIIEWRSDEEEFSIANRVTIEKVDDTFVLEFTRPYLSESKRFSGLLFSPNNIHIRFRNSGSTYDPYNAIFMRMFNKLQEYDPDNHQMHIEEMIHQRKLTLRK
jgi:hypothetical protein